MSQEKKGIRVFHQRSVSFHQADQEAAAFQTAAVDVEKAAKEMQLCFIQGEEASVLWRLPPQREDAEKAESVSVWLSKFQFPPRGSKGERLCTCS